MQVTDEPGGGGGALEERQRDDDAMVAREIPLDEAAHKRQCRHVGDTEVAPEETLVLGSIIRSSTEQFVELRELCDRSVRCERVAERREREVEREREVDDLKNSGTVCTADARTVGATSSCLSESLDELIDGVFVDILECSADLSFEEFVR